MQNECIRFWAHFAHVWPNAYVKLCRDQDNDNSHIVAVRTCGECGAFTGEPHDIDCSALSRQVRDPNTADGCSTQQVIADLMAEFNELHEYVSIAFIIGNRNGIETEETKYCVEAHISVNMQKKHSAIVEMLYETRPRSMSGILIVKYVACKQFAKPADLQFYASLLRSSFTDKFAQFIERRRSWFTAQTSTGANPNISHEMLVNLVIVVDAAAAPFFEEKTIVTASTQTTRRAHIPSHDIYLFFALLLGEHRIMFNVGYMEFVLDESFKSVEIDHYDTSSIFTLVDRINQMKRCSICKRTAQQVDLYDCDKCDKHKHCSELCRELNAPNHNNAQ